MAELAFHRTLRLGSTGNDVRAVKRALRRAGYGKGIAFDLPTLGANAVMRLRKFQRDAGIPTTGIYDETTHGKLIQFMDAWARRLYELASQKPAVPVDPKPPAVGTLRLPRTFVPTHQTAGLPGFPAVDVFAAPHTLVAAPAAGVVDRLSGRDPKLGGSPGGAYGWSIYLKSAHGRYFLTHFHRRDVVIGQRIREGEIIGTVADSAISGKPGTSHIHMGIQRS